MLLVCANTHVNQASGNRITVVFIPQFIVIEYDSVVLIQQSKQLAYQCVVFIQHLYYYSVGIAIGVG